MVQTYAFYGTDVDTVIQTVIQTVGIYGTDVQTVQYLKGVNLEPLILHGLYVCTINPNGLYNRLYADIHVCTAKYIQSVSA